MLMGINFKIIIDRHGDMPAQVDIRKARIISHPPFRSGSSLGWIRVKIATTGDPSRARPGFGNSSQRFQRAFVVEYVNLASKVSITAAQLCS